jgi:hypothetical protein
MMEYQDYFFTFGILNKSESRRFSITRHPKYLGIKLFFLYFRWQGK